MRECGASATTDAPTTATTETPGTKKRRKGATRKKGGIRDKREEKYH